MQPTRIGSVPLATLLLTLLPAVGVLAGEEALPWLQNAIGYHGFTVAEAAKAAGIEPSEAARLIEKHRVAPGLSAIPRPDGKIHLLPYPGGRHPRIGFLDGAIDPHREPKASLFLPWKDGGYAVVDLPEAVFSNLGLIYLAHTHIPTIWDRKSIQVQEREWERLPSGGLRSQRVLPNGIAIGAGIEPERDGARMELWLRNGTDADLSGLRVQVCVLLRGASGFDAQTNENRVQVKLPWGEAMAAKSADGKRWIAIAWERSRGWANPPCPCIHSDPVLPDCAPGATVRLRGRLLVGEGTDPAQVLMSRASDDGLLVRAETPASPKPLRAGAASAELPADDSMVIGGGIGPGQVKGQEGQLRAVAVVLGREAPDLAIVACDILMVQRDILDAAARTIERDLGIPFDAVLINATHTHHAPSTVTIHGYERDERFCAAVRESVVESVRLAAARMRTGTPHEFLYGRTTEGTVGQNSRLLLSDGTIFWVGPRGDAVRPTGPFDPDLQVLGFRDGSGALSGALFNHSTHNIGVRSGGKRSPGFYGLAAQDLESELRCPVSFVAGAFGSTHNLLLSGEEAARRMAESVRRGLDGARPRSSAILRARRAELRWRVRQFDEVAEDRQVVEYCTRRMGDPTYTIKVFREMRAKLKPQQGEERTSWVQALRIGDVAIAAVPGEFFTALGLEIKRRSPFSRTFVVGVANDYIGYIPDRAGFEQGGYQVWTGFHSLCEPGTGEKIVELAVELLEGLSRDG